MSNWNNHNQKFATYDYKKNRQEYYYKNKKLKNKNSHYYQNEQEFYNYYNYQQQNKQPQKHSELIINDNLGYDFSKLPNIVLKNIYSYLNLKEKLTASSTCSNWRNALYHPALWQKFTLKIYFLVRAPVSW